MDLADIINDAGRGYPLAQQSLYNLFFKKLLVVCKRYVKTAEDAEEVLSDGFIKFFKALHTFEYQGEAALYKWVSVIMINECLMFLRGKTSFVFVEEFLAEEVAIPEQALDDISASEVFKTLEELPVTYRTIFNLHVLEELSHQEIARLLGISEGYSKVQFCRAKQLILKKLTGKEGIYEQRAKQR